MKIHVRRSDAFRMQGRWDEAVEAMEAAHVLDAEGLVESSISNFSLMFQPNEQTL